MEEQKRIPEGSVKVGRINMTVARKIKRKCADIYLKPNYLKHIERRHKKELESLGLTAIDFVHMVAKHTTKSAKALEVPYYWSFSTEN